MNATLVTKNQSGPTFPSLMITPSRLTSGIIKQFNAIMTDPITPQRITDDRVGGKIAAIASTRTPATAQPIEIKKISANSMNGLVSS